MRQFRFAVCFIFVVSCMLFVFTIVNHKQEEEVSNKPVISGSDEELELKVADWSEDEKYLEGLSASDEEDGDLTSEIQISSISDFIEPGLVTVSYSVIDVDGNTASFTRNVRFTDYVSPVFSIVKEPVCIVGDEPDIKQFVSVEDSVDGDLTDSIEITSDKIDTKEEGLYPVSMEVTNSMGETVSYNMFVKVEEERQNQAAVKLTQYSVRLEKGDDFDAEDYIDEVLNGYGEAMSDPDMEITDEVNTDNPGLYPVVYRLADYFIDTAAVLMVEVKE